MFSAQKLFGIAAIITSIGFLFQSFSSANANIGPTISMGTNPIHHYFLNCDNQTDATIFTNSSNEAFIITDVYLYYGTVTLKIDGSTALMLRYYQGDNSGNAHIPFVSGIRVPSGSTLTCSDNNDTPRITISGYYAHP